MKATNTQIEEIIFGYTSEFEKFKKETETSILALKISLKNFDFKHCKPSIELGKQLFADTLSVIIEENKLVKQANNILNNK